MDISQLDRELREFLEKEVNLKKEDKLVYLKHIFSKHFEFAKMEHMINDIDLNLIISGAKSGYSKAKLPMNISGRQIDNVDVVHVSMVESIVSYFNKLGLLRKVIKFDYRG